jgi:hypothetical protein
MSRQELAEAVNAYLVATIGPRVRGDSMTALAGEVGRIGR